jgi:glutamate-1-semialdehyde 2,1-aminomutase
VPACLAALHHSASWNSIDSVESVFADYPDQIAAVVVASSYGSSTDGATFYPALRALADKHGALLVYDEIVTGFRLAIGGVQEYFGVKPDLAVFAKGIANGMPLSTYVGRRDIMSQFDKVTVSSTYGGETLSLAAAKAAITVYTTQGVIEHLWTQGERLFDGLDALFREHGLPMQMAGYAPLGLIQPKPDAPPGAFDQLKRAAYRNGISPYNVQYVNFSHKEHDIGEALERWDSACREVSASLDRA